MAGERKGKAYEALTKLILEELKELGVVKGRIFWDQKPDVMTIVPDLTIGRSRNAPDISLMISHGGSAKESNRKYWRNCGELFEYKLLLDSPVKVLSLFFDASIKPEIKELGQVTFDGELIVGDSTYGHALQGWIDRHISALPTDKDQKVEFLRAIREADKEFEHLCQLLRVDLEALVTKCPPEFLSQLWASERKRQAGTRPPGRVPAVKSTFVRRGLTKMSLLSNVGLAYKPGVVLEEADAELMLAAGLAKKTIRGVVIDDSEIDNTVGLIPVETARVVVRKLQLVAERWLSILRSSHLADEALKFIRSHFPVLSDYHNLFRLLERCHGDLIPNVRIKGFNWLFYYLVELIKAASGARQGYGIAQILADIAAHRRVPQTREAIERSLGGTASFRGIRSIERLISVQIGDRSAPRSATLFQDFPTDLYEICHALSARLNKLEVGALDRVSAQTLRAGLVQKAFENDLMTYRLFSPLKDLILVAVPTATPTFFRSCFNEKAAELGLREDSGTTSVLVAKKTLIKWQSAHGSHTNDKTKELCGRAVALRYSWDAKARKFVERPGIQKLVLVLDGTWGEGELNTLARGGWDEIFYPDEMDKLAKAII
jgi:hypothetical protein